MLAVSAERRTERAELEPSDVQFARVFGRRYESADVGTPIGNARQAGIDRNRDVGPKDFPAGADIARPEECGETLHAGVAVAMQGNRPLVRPPELGAFPVHPRAVSREGAS